MASGPIEADPVHELAGVPRVGSNRVATWSARSDCCDLPFAWSCRARRQCPVEGIRATDECLGLAHATRRLAPATRRCTQNAITPLPTMETP